MEKENIKELYERKKISKEQVNDLIEPGDAIVLPAAGCEPMVITPEFNKAKHFKGNRIYRMLALTPTIDLPEDQLKQYSFFLSGADRKAMRQAKVDLIPGHFSEIPSILKQREKEPILITAASPMNDEGYFSFGITSGYTPSVAKYAKKIILEVNENMPFVHGQDMQIHISDIDALVETDVPLPELPSMELSESEMSIGKTVADIVRDGDTIQIGFGSIPNAVMKALGDKKDLGIHSEMFPSTAVELAEKQALNNTKKELLPNKHVGTFVLGTKALYDFIDNNPDVYLMPVEYTNGLKELSQIDNLVSINTTLEVDFLGQCNSEQLEDFYYSNTGGQSDFAIGARVAKNGIGIVCLQSTAKKGTISRIVPHLHSGSPVSTSKNDVDIVVTEFGAAYLKNKSIQERVEALISVAHPDFRDELRNKAIELGYLVDNK